MLTGRISQIYAAVRGYCAVTDNQRIGSIARALRTWQVLGTTKPVITEQVNCTEHREGRDNEGEREGATSREGRPGSARRRIASPLSCGFPSHPAERLKQ